MNAFWRTLCADVIAELPGDMRRIRREEDRRKYELWKYCKDPGHDPAPDPSSDKHKVNTYHAAVVQAARSRRFFLTHTGYLGLGPADMSSGDQVYLISGSKVPFVLREFEELELPWRGNDAFLYPVYHIVREC